MQFSSAKSANEPYANQLSESKSSADANPPTVDVSDDMAALRRLIIGPILQRQQILEQRIGDLQVRLENPDIRSKDCSEVLGAAIEQLHSDNTQLSRQLEPEIMDGMEQGFKSQPDRMADALYPVLGPAVRKLVASLFQSPQAEIGKPYQVEQLFLIHKETSTVLSEAFLYGEAQRDADLVSGMLEAIRSFVRDAFSLHEFDGMNSIELGDLKVWVEWGPQAVLAIVIRGFPEESLRADYAEILRQIHSDFTDELERFDGDDEPFKRLDLALHQPDEAAELATQQTTSIFSLPNILLALFVGAMMMTAGSVSENRKWNQFIKALSDEPGVVVVDANNGWRRSEVTLLQDPYALPITPLISQTGIDDSKLIVKTHAFLSQDPAIVARRLHPVSRQNL